MKVAKVVGRNLGRAQYENDPATQTSTGMTYDQPQREVTPPTTGGGGGGGSTYVSPYAAEGYAQFYPNTTAYVEPAIPQPPPPPQNVPQPDPPSTNPPVPPVEPAIQPSQPIPGTYPQPTYPTPTQTYPATQTSWMTRINWKHVAMALGALSVVALLALLVSRRGRSGVNGFSDSIKGHTFREGMQLAKDLARR